MKFDLDKQALIGQLSEHALPFRARCLPTDEPSGTGAPVKGRTGCLVVFRPMEVFGILGEST
jgi:hypothetical protein